MGKILIVDDVPVSLKVLGELLREDYEVLVATNGRKAIEIALEKQPDLILMDVVMPEMDGLETCRQLKENKQTADIPVVFLTAMSESGDVIKGFEVGGQDYIVKPFRKAEVMVRAKNHIDLKKSKEKSQQYGLELEQKNRELESLLQKVEQMARTDFLTGISNRRNAVDLMDKELSRSNRSGEVFSLIMVDIDDFKKVNDIFGHECGDYVLIKVVELIQSMLRQQDMIARWGGEEFLLMLPVTDLIGAKVVAEKIRAYIYEQIFSYKDKSFKVTITMGVAQYQDGENLDGVIRRADEAMYQGKNSGKNCVWST